MVRKTENFLDKTITLKDLIVYFMYFILGIVLLAGIIFIPFKIGESYGISSCSNIAPINAASKVLAATATSKTDNLSNNTSTMNITEPTVNTSTEEEEEEEANLTTNQTEEEPEVTTPVKTSYGRYDSEVTTTYTKVDVLLADFEYELKTDIWGKITKIKLTIKNGESKIILPYSVEVSVWNQGEPSPEWKGEIIQINNLVPYLTGNNQRSLYINPEGLSFNEITGDKMIELIVKDEIGKVIASDEFRVSID